MATHGGARKGAGRKSPCPDGDKTKTVSFQVCTKLHEQLKDWCKEKDAEKSIIINTLIAEFLDKE